MKLQSLAVTMAVLMSMPIAAATAPFTTADLALHGNVQADGFAGGVLVRADETPISWSISAAHIVVERTYMNITRVDSPHHEDGTATLYGDHPLMMKDVRETYTLADARLAATSSRDEGILFARENGDPLAVRAITKGAMQVSAVVDPVIRSEPQRFTNVHLPSFAIQGMIPGAFVNMTSSVADVELVGDLVLYLYGVDYASESLDGFGAHRTGFYELSSYPGVSRARVEVHRLMLTDAVVRIQAQGHVSLFARDPALTIDGRVSSPDGTGALVLGEDAHRLDAAPLDWHGRADLSIKTRGDVLQVTTARASGAALIPLAVPALPEWVVVVGVVAATITLFGAWLLHRMRRDEAHVELALLAMQESRWGDALVHIDRALAQVPDDAVLLLDRAICHEHRGDLQDARLSFEAALRAAPTHAEAHYYYARVLARLHISTACLAHLSRALGLDARLSELARHEPAFAPFGDHPQFLSLVPPDPAFRR